MRKEWPKKQVSCPKEWKQVLELSQSKCLCGHSLIHLHSKHYIQALFLSGTSGINQLCEFQSTLQVLVCHGNGKRYPREPDCSLSGAVSDSVLSTTACLILLGWGRIATVVFFWTVFKVCDSLGGSPWRLQVVSELTSSYIVRLFHCLKFLCASGSPFVH